MQTTASLTRKLQGGTKGGRQGSRRVSLGLALLVVLLLLGVAGCGKKRSRIRVPIIPTTGEGEVGLASWYGHPYHGRQTANGETYDMDDMTAAHRTLAFNTWIRVVNLENNLTTIVRINDRGPFIEGRIIDLSRSGAEEIEMVGPGTALVRLEIVEHPDVEMEAEQFSVQVGAFLVPENAEKMQRLIARKFSGVFIDTSQKADGLYYRVRVGRQSTMQAAEAVRDRLRRQDEITNAVIVRLN